MAYIVLNYHTAMASGMDAANASMRKAGRTAWSRADYNVSVRTVEKLAKALYRANHPEAKRVNLDEAFYELQQTADQPSVVYASKKSRAA